MVKSNAFGNSGLQKSVGLATYILPIAMYYALAIAVETPLEFPALPNLQILLVFCIAELINRVDYSSVFIDTEPRQRYPILATHANNSAVLIDTKRSP